MNTYYTAKLCRHGHDSLRRVSSGACVACEEAWRAANIPRASRIIRAGKGKTKTRAVELHIEPETEVLATCVKYRLKQILGRPVSGSVLYRTGVRLIAERLADNSDARATFEMVA